MQNFRTVSKLGRVCCKTSKLCRIPKSLSMSIDIVWSLFIVLIDSLYLSSIVPSRHSYRSIPTRSYQFWLYNCSRNITKIMKASNSISIIISYRVAQQLRTPLEILSLERCWLSGILSKRIFQIQKLSFQPCDHSTCQTPGSFRWWSVNNLGCKEMKHKQKTFCRGHFNQELRFFVSHYQNSRTKQPWKVLVKNPKASYASVELR